MLKNIFAAFFLFLGSSVAQEVPKELLALQDSYANAKSQALAPLEKKYVEALQVLLKRYTQEGRLQDALVVDTTLKTIAGQNGASSDSASKSPATMLGSSRPAKELNLSGPDAKLSGKSLIIDKYNKSIITAWAVGDSASWSKTKVPSGSYGLALTCGGFRPKKHKFRVTIGAVIKEFEIQPNTSSYVKVSPVDVGQIEIGENSVGVKIECIDIGPEDGSAKNSVNLSELNLIPVPTKP